MAKRRKTIGRNPLDELAVLRGRGRRAHVASIDPTVTKDIRSMLSCRPPKARPAPSLLAQFNSAIDKLNPFK